MPGQVPPSRRMLKQGRTLGRRMQGLSARIETTDFRVEYLGKYTETHNIAYGIVADIFFARYSLLVSRCSNLIAFF